MSPKTLNQTVETPAAVASGGLILITSLLFTNSRVPRPGNPDLRGRDLEGTRSPSCLPTESSAQGSAIDVQGRSGSG